MSLAALRQSFEFNPEITPLRVSPSLWKGCQVDCLRLDKVHSFISGNKWYKLKFHLDAARRAGKTKILSFGGAHSNHLHALAYAGNLMGVETLGVIRGEPANSLTPTLQDCEKWGMKLEWLSRRDYRAVAPIQDHHPFLEEYPDTWIVPEGGAGEAGIRGITELFRGLHKRGCAGYDYIVCPVGSGTTLAGVAAADLPGVNAIGISALKGALGLEHSVELMLEHVAKAGKWQILHDYHFGGFAKMNERLKSFISDFYDQQGILLDPVYTGKMMFGVMESIMQGRIANGSNILIVHTGGLQGWRGFGESWPVVGNEK